MLPARKSWKKPHAAPASQTGARRCGVHLLEASMGGAINQLEALAARTRRAPIASAVGSRRHAPVVKTRRSLHSASSG
jgi:hypothetical protein